MVVAAALKGYPTAVEAHPKLELVDETPEASLSEGLAKEELRAGRRVAIRKPTGELILAQMAGDVDRTTVRIRPELDNTTGTYGPAEFVDLKSDETVFLPHPQEHLPGIDFQTFVVNSVPRVLDRASEPIQERLF